jgi:hypothetical protein
MQSKRTILMIGVLILVVGSAAFVGGRMLNSNVGPLGVFGLGGKGDVMSFAINVIPAEELPKTPPEARGLFVERKDKTIVIQTVSLDVGGKGVVVAKGGGEGEAVAGSPIDSDSGPKVEVVITNETIVYKETTDIGEPSSMEAGETQTVQQTVEESTLDHLNSQSMVTVWGRKSGDRIIADVLFYSNPVIFKRQGP